MNITRPIYAVSIMHNYEPKVVRVIKTHGPTLHERKMLVTYVPNLMQLFHFVRIYLCQATVLCWKVSDTKSNSVKSSIEEAIGGFRRIEG
jgi:hypothetical protein